MKLFSLFRRIWTTKHLEAADRFRYLDAFGRRNIWKLLTGFAKALFRSIWTTKHLEAADRFRYFGLFGH